MSRVDKLPVRPALEPARIQAILAASTFFGDLPRASADRLASIARIVRFRDGELVQGALPPQPRFFLVLSGALRISPIMGQDGSATTLAVMGPGAAYGAAYFVYPENLMWGESYAVGETELAVMEGSPFRLALQSDPILERHISALVVRRFNAILSLFRDVVKAPLSQRLARRLLTQALSLNRATGTQEIQVDVTQAMLAEMLGVSRCQVSAELKRWHQAGIVRAGYRRVYILDSAALCQIAGPDVRPF